MRDHKMRGVHEMRQEVHIVSEVEMRELHECGAVLVVVLAVGVKFVVKVVVKVVVLEGSPCSQRGKIADGYNLLHL